MKILKIEAGCEVIKLYTDEDGDVMVRESVPTVGIKPGWTLSMVPADAKDGVITLPRMGEKNDRIFSRFTVYANGKAAEGVKIRRFRKVKRQCCHRCAIVGTEPF